MPRKIPLPLRDAFAVLFFVSVGMLFDPMILLREPLAVLASLAIIIFGKSAAAFILVVVWSLKTHGSHHFRQFGTNPESSPLFWQDWVFLLV